MKPLLSFPVEYKRCFVGLEELGKQCIDIKGDSSVNGRYTAGLGSDINATAAVMLLSEPVACGDGSQQIYLQNTCVILILDWAKTLSVLSEILYTMLKLTVKDICAALGVPRHRIRAWTQLPPFRNQPTHARSARRFDTLDLLLMAILQSLEDNYGLRHAALGQAAPAIMRFLSRPRGSHYGNSAYLDITTWQMHPVTPELVLRAGFIIDVERERERVVKFLGLGPVQRELALGPVAVGQKKLGRSM